MRALEWLVRSVSDVRFTTTPKDQKIGPHPRIYPTPAAPLRCVSTRLRTKRSILQFVPSKERSRHTHRSSIKHLVAYVGAINNDLVVIGKSRRYIE